MKTLAVILFLSLGLGIAIDAAAEERPNVVLIVADDLGINDLGCYGRTEHKTPHLDRLAKEGTLFTNAYCASPICSASRAGLMTGKHPARLHLTTYLPGRPDAPSQKLLQPRIEPGLIPSEQTIAEVLKRAGYATGLFGKWHLGGGESAAMKQGFDIAFEPAGNGDPATMGGKNEILITEKAIEFIKTPRQSLYFCYVAHHSPHIPLAAAKEKIEGNSAAWNPLYAATVESLDDAVGKLLKAIDDTGAVENTLVIFTSDNGGLHVPEIHEEPVTHNGRYRAGKGFLYEGGLRVPLILRWPKNFNLEREKESRVSLLDLLPTICDAAEIDVAKTVGPIDGKSFYYEARAGRVRSVHEEPTLYFHIPHYTNQGGRPAGAILSSSWKYIEDYETGARELYDIRRDPGEENNLINSDKHNYLALEMPRRLAAWRKQVGAQENVLNPQFDETLHKKLYIDQDSTRLLGRDSTAKQIAEQWKSWRAAMNEAVKGRKPVLNRSSEAVRLEASAAKVHGKNIRYEPETYKNVVGYWTEADDWAEWEFESPIEGKAEVQIQCGCNGGGSEVDVILKSPGAADQVLKWTVRNTGHFQNFVVENLGEAKLAKGKWTLEVRPRRKEGAAVVDIRQICLVPAEESRK